jgi:predicted P-loop ATPase
MGKRWGALPEDWAHFKRLAKRDLLPVVSNPEAEISPRSKMKGKGKTPSLYNHNGHVAGFPDWTDFEAIVPNIEAWSKEPDYGLCIQTRRIRALDIDVPDTDLSARIARMFLGALGQAEPLPARQRQGTGKQLLAFVLEGDWSKRAFAVKEWQEDGKTKRWLVEFLAGGQQFIAAGTHSDGVSRYEWAGGLPATIPTITAEAFERAWQALSDEFALEGTERRASRRDPTLIEDLHVADPVAEHLVESEWPTYSIEKGMLYLECPWKDGHSSDNGETETAWLLAGTGKYRNGHFACRHAGCANHTDSEFFQAVGYKPVKASEFEDLGKDTATAELYAKLAPSASAKSKELKAERRVLTQTEAGKAALPLPGFYRDDQGRIETCLENLVRALRAPQACECELRYDEFRGELMIAEQPGQWRSFQDADAVDMRMRLEALGFKDRIGKELMRDALVKVSAEQRFDSAREWLMTVVPEWDGVRRLETFWPRLMKTKDTPYTRALGLYSWTAQAGRVLDPGCQVDMVPVLVGPRACARRRRSRCWPPPSISTRSSSWTKDEELSRLMRGCLVGELEELRGVSARDGEAVLAWVTRRNEKWTPKYQEYATTLPRRLVFYGTTNDEDFLQAHMGERRWLPVTITELIDTDKIAAERDQLWAEARDHWLADGVAWAEVEQLAKAERHAFRHVDIWHDRIARWLDDDQDLDAPTPRHSGTLTTEEVLLQCLGLEAAKVRKADQMRVAAILSTLGMERRQRWIGSRNVKGWVDAGRPDDD